MLAALVCVLAPAGSAQADRAWQPPQFQLEAGTVPHTQGPVIAMDPQGDTVASAGGGVRVRPHGGAFGPILDPPVSFWPTRMAFNEAGDVVAANVESAWRPHGAASAFGPAHDHELTIDVLAMSPGGQVLALGRDRDDLDLVHVLFREAGPEAAFAPVGGPLPLHPGDGRAEAVGAAITPAGARLVVYRSLPSSAILQAVASPGEDFGTPTVVAASADTPQPRFASSTNGHALLAWTEDAHGLGSHVVKAAFAEPGQPLPAPATVVTKGGDEGIRSGPSLAMAVTDSGAAYIGWNAIRDPTWGASICEREAEGAELATRTDADPAWKVAPLGVNAYPHITKLELSTDAPIHAMGDRVLLPVLHYDGSGAADPNCDRADVVPSLRVRLGTGGVLGPASTLDTTGPGTDGPRVTGIGLNAVGDALVVYNTHGSGATYRVFEDRSPPAGGGGTNNGGSEEVRDPDVGSAPPGADGDRGPTRAPIDSLAEPLFPRPGPARGLGRLTVGRALAVDRRGRLVLRAQCTAATTCRFTFTIRRARSVVLGRATAMVAPGTRRTVRLTLGRTARRILAKRRSLPVTIEMRVGAGAATSTSRHAVVLRPARRG